MRRRILAASSLIVLAVAMSGCLPDPAEEAAASSATPVTASPTASPTPSVSPTPSATPATLPTDCRAILNQDVLDQFGDLPLNDPAYGDDAGVQADGSLICHWGYPDTDTGRLVTTVSAMNRGPALDLLNELYDEGYSCYAPDEGTRCELTWIDEQYPVTDGRTVYWRDDILIDTQYVDLAPSGYTDAIIASLWG